MHLLGSKPNSLAKMALGVAQLFSIKAGLPLINSVSEQIKTARKCHTQQIIIKTKNNKKNNTSDICYPAFFSIHPQDKHILLRFY